MNKQEELVKKMRDPKFYLENFCKIKGKDPGLIPFILNEAQKDIFNTLRHHNRVIILKARQIGFSSAITGYFYVKTIMTPGTNTALIGYNSDLTAELLDKVKTFYQSTPPELRPTIDYNTKYEISFPSIKSKILVLPSTMTVGRGYTLHNCLLTELSFWDKQDEKMTAIENSVPENGTIVVESCVTGDTIVLTDDGPRRMGKIHNWEDNDLGFSNGKEIKLDGHYGLQPTSTYYNSGVKKGVRITTERGLELGMSSVHKTYVLKEDKLVFVRAKDLKIGDMVAVKYGQEIWGNNNKIKWKPSPYGFNKKWLKQFAPKGMTSDLAYLIGLIIGDGYIDFRQGRVVVTNIDEDVINFLINNNLGLNFLQSKGSDHYHYICKNSSFVEFLKDYVGLYKAKAKDKIIPDIVFTWSRENVSSFLQGLFDADGCCDSTRGRIFFYSTSKQIIDTIRILLLNFGILSRTTSHIARPTERVKVKSLVYTISIEAGYFAGIFADKIGFRIKRKQNNIRKLKGPSLSEIIPGIGSILKMNMKELGLLYKDISRGLNRGFFSSTGNVTYNTLNRIMEKCRNKESLAYKRVEKLYSYHYSYEKIKNIQEIEENVYDFTVNNGHTVTYNGIVGHQTPNGMGNLYHRMFMAEDNGYKKKRYGWWWAYSKEEIEKKRKRMNNPLKFAQEYGLEFLTSGRPVFDVNVLKEQRKNIIKEGEVVKYKDNEGKEQEFTVQVIDMLRVYKPPRKDGIYVLGADVSEGVDGGDYSVAVIWDRQTGEEVAFFRGLLPADRFADMLNKWGRWYNNALMVVEINNHGLTTVTCLRQHVYPTMYFRPAQYETIAQATSDKIGWKTTRLTKPLLIDDLAQAMRDDILIFHSKEILDEMASFVYNDNGDAVAQDGSHDDTIIASGIGYQGFKKIYHSKLTQLNYREHLPRSFAY